MKKQYTLGLLSIAMLGVISLPAVADDTAVIQRNSQDVYIEGAYNEAVQGNEQLNWSQRFKMQGQSGNTGVVQESAQGGAILGTGNASYQLNRQQNVIQNIQRNKKPQRSQIYIQQQ
jgi:hypothetical protein